MGWGSRGGRGSWGDRGDCGGKDGRVVDEVMQEKKAMGHPPKNGKKIM